MPRKPATIEYTSGAGTITVYKKAIEGIKKKAYIRGMYVKNLPCYGYLNNNYGPVLIINYESKSGRTRGTMELYDVKLKEATSL